MSTTQTPRKRLTAEKRRAAILEAALEVIAGRGYHQSSIDDIARSAGISKALIYEHFASKQELYGNLVEYHAGELFERLAGAVSETDSAALRLSSGIDAFFSFVEERRDAWRMLFREATDPEVAAVLGRVVAQVTAVVATLIAEDPGSLSGIEDERTREQGIVMLAQMLVGAMQSLANWWADHQEVPRERLVEVAMDFAWVGLQRLGKGARWPDARA